MTSTDSNVTILPPATASNPIPALPAALRLDNQEQLVTILSSKPEFLLSPSFRQVLVFGTSSLRTLLMRQVLSTPETTTKAMLSNAVAGKKKNSTTNWDSILAYPDVPKNLNLIGTRILKDSSSLATKTNDENNITNRSSNSTLLEELWKSDGLYNSWMTGTSPSSSSSSCTIVVTYFLRPNDLEQTQLAMHHMNCWKQQQLLANANRKKSDGSGSIVFHTHHRYLYLPHITAVIQKIHQNNGLKATPSTSQQSPSTVPSNTTISIDQLQLDIFPLETDVLSLEYDEAFKEDVIEETPSNLITTAARCIQKLQDVVGPIPRIQTFGPIAEEVLKKFLTMSVDEYLSSNNNSNNNHDDDHHHGLSSIYNNGTANVVEGGDVTALILMDRKIDLVSPLVTTLTYEGLLDDIIGIDCGYIAVDVNVINPDNDEKITNNEGNQSRAVDRIVALGVNGSDSLFTEVRNQHVEKFGSFLQNQAKALQQSHANFTDKNKKKELTEIHQFVKQIPIFTQNLRSLTNHIHIAELIKRTSEDILFREKWQLERTILEGEVCYDQIEDTLATMQYTPYNFFRLLCLQSICSGGIKSSRYDSMKRDIVQTYGYDYLFVLTNFEKANVLRRRDGLWIDTASSYNTLRKALALINAEVDTVEPDDVSYVSSGYAPLSIRIVQTAMKGWIGREDILRELPGKHHDIIQRSPPEDLAVSSCKIKNPATSAVNVNRSTAIPGTTRLTGISLGQYGIDASNASEQQQPGNSAFVAATSTGTTSKKPVLIVFYIGGVTYMEIAALRFLSKRQNFPYHIICITTKIINGVTFLKSLT